MTCSRGRRLVLPVLCMVAFFGYNIRPDLVATHDEVHPEECMARK